MVNNIVRDPSGHVNVNLMIESSDKALNQTFQNLNIIQESNDYQNNLDEYQAYDL